MRFDGGIKVCFLIGELALIYGVRVKCSIEQVDGEGNALAYLYLRTVPDPTSRCGLTFDTDSKLQLTDIIELCPWTARYAGSSDLCLRYLPVPGI